MNAADYSREFSDISSIQTMEEMTSQPKITLTEGGLKVIVSVVYERNARLRNLAVKAHGYKCIVCGFDFTAAYGDWGAGFAEVHHIVPVSESGKEKKVVDPERDLVVVCTNCHRMMHRKKGITLSVDELKSKIQAKTMRPDLTFRT